MANPTDNQAAGNRTQGNGSVEPFMHRRPHGWKSRLAEILREHSRQRSGHRTGDMRRKSSFATQQNVGNGLFRLFRQLHEMGFQLENPRNLHIKHVKALYQWMEERFEAGELSSATIQGYVSYLRKFSRWIGKPDLLSSPHVSFTNPDCARRTQNTEIDRSWEACEIDIGSVIDTATEIQPWIGAALLAQTAFGLRRKEALCFRPSADYQGNGLIQISRGTKGGRIRIIALHTQWQYEVLAFLTAYCHRNRNESGFIGDPDRTLEANLRHYSYILAKRLKITKDEVGTTGHGLRAGFACRTLEAFGITPPVRGGNVSQADRETVAVAYSATTEALGHSRRQIAGAYVGSSRLKGDTPHPDGMDLTRINPPNIAALIDTMHAHLAEGRLDRFAINRIAGQSATTTET